MTHILNPLSNAALLSAPTSPAAGPRPPPPSPFRKRGADTHPTPFRCSPDMLRPPHFTSRHQRNRTVHASHGNISACLPRALQREGALHARVIDLVHEEAPAPATPSGATHTPTVRRLACRLACSRRRWHATYTSAPAIQVFLIDVVAGTLKVCTGRWCHAQPATLATRFHFAPLRPRLLLTAAPVATMTEGLRGNSAPRHRRMYGKFLAFRSDGTPRRRPHNRSRRPQL